MDRKTLRRLSLFEKTEFVRKLVVEILGVDNDERILRMLARLAHKSGRIKLYGKFIPTREEEVLEQVLTSNQISSKTAYMWFLLGRSPKTLLELYRKGELSQNQLIRMKERSPISRPRDKALANEILAEIRRLVGAI